MTNSFDCPHCGKRISIEEAVFRLDHETALLELILAQMAKVYRTEFGKGFPTEGESDLEALQQLFVTVKESDDRLTIDSVARILEFWQEYLKTQGTRGTIDEFVFTWLPSQDPGAKVIPFRPRGS
jgi:hypothetical protein